MPKANNPWNRILTMRNQVMAYAWGSRTAIADLLGVPSPAPEPQAELWMGSHPKAPSQVQINDRWIPLDRLIRDHPEELLGADTAARFANRLPFLLKVLAAAAPLSIQAHPSKAQAREGFAAENRRQIPLDAPQRNYRDDNHKPECICALTPFWALCGFRKVDRIAALLHLAAPRELQAEIARLGGVSPDEALRGLFKALTTMAAPRREAVLSETLENAEKNGEDPIFNWIPKLAAAYPGDMGALAPLFLNLVCLAPGEALFLGAGELHAYLDGVGIEVMANSDNVLRGGLTPKHMDVPELLKVLNFKERCLEVLTPVKAPRLGLGRYPGDAAEFALEVITLGGPKGAALELNHRGCQILLCTDGQMSLAVPASGQHLTLPKGGSVCVPAAVGDYRIEGRGTLFRALTPSPLRITL